MIVFRFFSLPGVEVCGKVAFAFFLTEYSMMSLLQMMVLIRLRIGNKPERAIDKQFVTSHQCVCCPRVSQSPLIYDVCFQKDARLRRQSGTGMGMEGELFVVHLLRCCSFNATDSYQQHPLWAYQATQHRCRFSEHCGGFPQVSFTSWCFPSKWNNNNKNVIREKHWSFVFGFFLLYLTTACCFHPIWSFVFFTHSLSIFFLGFHLLVGFTHHKWTDCKVTTFISTCHWWQNTVKKTWVPAHFSILCFQGARLFFSPSDVEQ